MESEENANLICWFCRKGRHDECMKKIPTDAKTEGPHDCAFVSKAQSCGPSVFASVGIFFIHSSWRPFLQNQQIRLAFSSDSMSISILKNSYISWCRSMVVFALMEF